MSKRVIANKKRYSWLQVLVLVLGSSAFWSYGAVAELAVVVSVDSKASTITSKELSNIFLGKTRALENGYKVIPIDQLEGQLARNEFYEKIMQKSQSQLNSYWSRLIFTGKGRPPFMANDDQEVMEFIAANPNMIGYVNKESVDDSVKVIMVIK